MTQISERFFELKQKLTRNGLSSEERREFEAYDIGATRKLQHYLRAAVVLCSVVLVLTRMLSAQDNTTSKIPEREAQFTQEQLAQYYLVYKNPDVRYLRSLVDSYLNGSGGTEQEHEILSKWTRHTSAANSSSCRVMATCLAARS